MQFEIADLFSFRNAATSPLAWVAVLLLGAYLLGAAKLWRSRRGWSVLKSVSFALGCVLLFLVTGVVLLLVSVQLSYEVSRLENRVRRLAEEVAILNERTAPRPPDGPDGG